MGVLAAGTALDVDWTAGIQEAAESGVGVISDNVLYLFALPIVWVGYKVVRKVIAKIG